MKALTRRITRLEDLLPPGPEPCNYDFSILPTDLLRRVLDADGDFTRLNSKDLELLKKAQIVPDEP
jgi:hypothetical protein